MALTDMALRKATNDTGKTKYLTVGGDAKGLKLRITANGAKGWTLRLYIDGKRHELGLGGYPEVSLKAATEKALSFRQRVRDGGDPLQDKRDAIAARRRDAAMDFTFTQAVDGWMALSTSASEKNRTLTRNRIRSYAEVSIGGHRVSAVSTDQVVAILEPIWDSKTATATRLREDMARVFDWALGNGHMEGQNPAAWKGNLQYKLKTPKKVKQHRPAVATKDAPRFMKELSGRKGRGTQALAFTILTAARSGETRGMVWDEVDFDTGVWIIPAARMKMSKAHRVPLSTQALALLDGMNRTSKFVFPAVRGGQLSDGTLNATMRRIHEDDEQGFVDAESGSPAVTHGWRSTFRVWTAERGYARDMSEIALAHQVGSDAERAYARSDMVERRRVMMQDWADFLYGAGGASNVVRLAG